MLARTKCYALIGIHGEPVTVEAYVSSASLFQFNIVGLPDAAVKESRDRVGAALKNSGFTMPVGRTVVNLSPADLRKEGTAFDLPIAIAIILAFVLNRTRFGRNIYAIGGNRPAAVLVGIPVKRIEMVVFGLSGMLAALAGCVVIIIRRRSVAVGLAGEIGIACGITLVGALLLPIKFGTKSLWAIPYTFFPGARSLRAVDRIVLIGGLLAVMIIAIALQSLRNREVREGRSQRREAIGLAMLLGFIVVEQFNVGDTSSVDRSDQLRALREAPAPPPACQAFYITDSDPAETVAYTSSIDAMLIAQHFSIPTLNGYAGQFPRGFTFFEPSNDDYLEVVHAWADKYGVSEGLCSYDRDTRLWSTDA